MGAVQPIKTPAPARRLVGAERDDAKDPTADARVVVDQAREDLTKMQASQRARVEKAVAKHREDPTDENADAVAVAERSAQIQIERLALKLKDAMVLLEKAEGEARAERIAKLEGELRALPSRIAALAEKAKAPVSALLAIASERDELLAAGIGTLSELCALRDDDGEKESLLRQGVNANRGILPTTIAQLIHVADRAKAVDLLNSPTSPHSPAPAAASGDDAA